MDRQVRLARPRRLVMSARQWEWVVCQDFVERRLKAPATAEYPARYTDYTTSLGLNRFRVDAYVDAENSFGALVRTEFSCMVRYEGDGNWRLEDLVIDE